jgi:hypothetical protein
MDERDLLICALANALCEQCKTSIELRRGYRDPYSDDFHSRNQAGIALAYHGRIVRQYSASAIEERSVSLQRSFSDVATPHGEELLDPLPPTDS